MDRLLSWDTSLFLFINHLPHTPWTNMFALALSGAGAAGIIWFLLAAVLFLKEEHKHHRFFIPIGLVGAISGAIVNLILKSLIARPRPDIAMGAMIIGNGSFDYSFPSGHATMSFTAAVVLSRIEPRWRALFYVLAILISLSRIYLGKHYPLDILTGTLLGVAIGILSLRMTRTLFKKIYVTMFRNIVT